MTRQEKNGGLAVRQLNSTRPTRHLEDESTSLNSQEERIRETLNRQGSLMTASSRDLGQILICEGCCCGQTERGFPRVPLDWIKQRWKEERLSKSVQLSISGCLGPCDLANVVCVVSSQRMQWLGRLQEQRQYDTLLDWAIASRDAGAPLELPAVLNPHRFERFAAEPCEQSVCVQPTTTRYQKVST